MQILRNNYLVKAGVLDIKFLETKDRLREVLSSQQLLFHRNQSGVEVGEIGRGGVILNLATMSEEPSLLMAVSEDGV